MILAYSRDGEGRLQPANLAADAAPDAAAGALWIDAVDPDYDELERLSRFAGVEMPSRRDMTEIELSNRLYRDGPATVIIAGLVPKSIVDVPPPRPVAFVILPNALVTLRYAAFYAFERVAAELRAPASADNASPAELFVRLMDETVGDRADELEYAMRHLEELTSRLFGTGRPRPVPSAPGGSGPGPNPGSGPAAGSGGASAAGAGPFAAPGADPAPENPGLDEAMRRIGGMGEWVANIRESIASIQRCLTYARTHVHDCASPGRGERLDAMKGDLVALADEAAFFMNKLSFNLDATLGMINIEETKIIRLLSIVTLLLSPPTLIAGIYGMNFRVMPELDWAAGYLLALGLMGATTWLSIRFLKRKKWM